MASKFAISSGERILDFLRSSLSPKTVEALICTQNWVRGKTTLLDLCLVLEEMEICEKIENGKCCLQLLFVWNIVISFIFIYLNYLLGMFF